MGSPVQSVVGTRAQGRSQSAPSVKPFLKWAGGKRQLLPALRRFYPAKFKTYREPFLGSGAVFFDLINQQAIRPNRCVLTDMNTDLIGCYLRLRDSLERVIAHLMTLESDYKVAPSEHYYRVRNEQFNPARAEISNGSGPIADQYSAELAAMLIYLNRTGFNGLFRLNSKGMFNVPLGRYANPTICDTDNLRSVSEALSQPGITIRHTSYRELVRSAGGGDFVYLDPPYAPLSSTAQFTSYTSQGFSSTDQRELQQAVIALARKGCWVLLSNSTATEVAELYDGDRAASRAGIRAHKVPARRAINSNAARRGKVMEDLITNIPERPE